MIPRVPTQRALQASFDPYGRLLKMLVPSVQSVIVHDGAAKFLWSAENSYSGEADAFVRLTIQGAAHDSQIHPGFVAQLNADECAYGFAVRGDGTELLGVVTLVTRLCGSQTEARPASYVLQLVQPALECLKRELALRASLDSSEHDLGVRERDLSFMMEMSGHHAAATGDADQLRLILQTGIEHMDAALAAIWVPEKNLAVSLTRSGQPMSGEVLAGIQKHLLAWMMLQQRTIIVNRTAAGAGEAAPYKILACPIRHPSERVMGAMVLFNPPSAPDFDVNQARIAELLAKKAAGLIQAQYDASTGLMTRQAFERHADVLLAADKQAVHAILYMDIDRLHVVNETFGMHIGDQIIVRIAEATAKLLPSGALSARISGDRFAALLPNTSLDQATAVAEIIRGAIERVKESTAASTLDVSASIGVAPVMGSQNPLAHALATAEIACKAAKDRGRNRVEVYQDSDQSIIRRHTDVMVVGRIREALQLDRFRLDAQPILALRGNCGGPRFELLLRMIGETGEDIAPAKFISSAERYQLMPSIDRWVVQKTCELLGEHGSVLHQDNARFAINLSGQSLQDETFLGFVIERIKASGLAPSILCFELTETATIGNLEKAQAFMSALQSLGCQFALDDFGTGVSSLAYLKALAVSYLKIDGSFVRDALGNPRSESMIKAIAQLAKVMCMETIAEYVETDALRIRMAELGVDYGQGFAMGRAQPLTHVLHELAVFEATATGWSAPADFDISEALAS